MENKCILNNVQTQTIEMNDDYRGCVSKNVFTIKLLIYFL